MERSNGPNKVSLPVLHPPRPTQPMVVDKVKRFLEVLFPTIMNKIGHEANISKILRRYVGLFWGHVPRSVFYPNDHGNERREVIGSQQITEKIMYMFVAVDFFDGTSREHKKIWERHKHTHTISMHLIVCLPSFLPQELHHREIQRASKRTERKRGRKREPGNWVSRPVNRNTSGRIEWSKTMEASGGPKLSWL